MIYLILGVFGFVGMLIFDVMSMKNLPVLKYVFLFLGVGLLFFSTYQLCVVEQFFMVDTIMRYVSLLLSLVFVALLVYSVFIEVGANTYQSTAEPKLITNGTYSLVRHPGVIWLFFALMFASFYFESFHLLVASVVWTIVNATYTWIQEKLIFNRIFKDYDNYTQTTPMIIPNFNSMKKFLNTNNWRKE